MRKDVAYFRTLPYTRRAEPRAEDGYSYWLATVVELPSIEIHGETREQALTRLDEIFDDCIEAMLEAGEAIPEPRCWPDGLFERAARRNLRRIARADKEGRTPTQASSTADQLLGDGDNLSPWSEPPTDAAALTNSVT